MARSWFFGHRSLAVSGAFGNYVVPLQIGAPDMAFPRLNMASYHFYFWGGVVMLASFFVPEGAAKAGWTSYPPLADIETMGQTMWLWGMVLLITSSLLGAINFIVTIIQLRAEGMTFFRLPFFCLGTVYYCFPTVVGFPSTGGSGFSAISRPTPRNQLLFAKWTCHRGWAAGSCGWRESVALAALVLVSGTSRGLCSDSPSNGGYIRDSG